MGRAAQRRLGSAAAVCSHAPPCSHVPRLAARLHHTSPGPAPIPIPSPLAVLCPACLPQERSDSSPTFGSLTVPAGMVGRVIGSGGSNIRQLEEEADVRLDVDGDSGEAALLLPPPLLLPLPLPLPPLPLPLLLLLLLLARFSKGL